MPLLAPGVESAVVPRAARVAGVLFSASATMSGRPLGMSPVFTCVQPSAATHPITAELRLGGVVFALAPVRLSISRYAVTGRETVVFITNVALSRLLFIV